jgi:hypothetical protein
MIQLRRHPVILSAGTYLSLVDSLVLELSLVHGRSSESVDLGIPFNAPSIKST